MQSIVIIDNVREPLANGTICISLVLIAITFLGATYEILMGSSQKIGVKLFLSGFISLIAIIGVVAIYCYALYGGKLNSIDFLINLSLMITLPVISNYLITNVIMKESQAATVSPDSRLKRKRIKL